jgi:hypothetical protein
MNINLLVDSPFSGNCRKKDEAKMATATAPPAAH